MFTYMLSLSHSFQGYPIMDIPACHKVCLSWTPQSLEVRYYDLAINLFNQTYNIYYILASNTESLVLIRLSADLKD